VLRVLQEKVSTAKRTHLEKVWNLKEKGRKEETFPPRKIISMSTETDSAMGGVGCSSALYSSTTFLSSSSSSFLILVYVINGLCDAKHI